jgi:hypothetical protein
MSLLFPAFRRGAAVLLLIANTIPKNGVHSFQLPSLASSRCGMYKQARTTTATTTSLPAMLRFGSQSALALAPPSSTPFSVRANCVIRKFATSHAGMINATPLRRSRSLGDVTMRAASSAVDGTKTDGTQQQRKTGKIPIVILGGFLGAGKTTALKRLLENTEGIKVGTIVNDVASVNIDAKLLSNPMNVGGGGGGVDGGKSAGTVGKGTVGGTVELQNGCAW